VRFHCHNDELIIPYAMSDSYSGLQKFFAWFACRTDRKRIEMIRLEKYSVKKDFRGSIVKMTRYSKNPNITKKDVDPVDVNSIFKSRCS